MLLSRIRNQVPFWHLDPGFRKKFFRIPAKWRLSTFDLYTWGEGHGVQGQICDILRPQLAMNRLLPLWPHRFPHFGYIHLGGGGVGGGSDIRSMSIIRPICKCRCLGSQTHILRAQWQFFGKNQNVLWFVVSLPNLFLYLFRNKIIFIVVIFMATKKGRTNFFPSVVGSWSRDG